MTQTFKSRDCYTASGLPKRRYARRRDAKRAVRKMYGLKVEPYRCPSCDRWHVGHPPSRGAR